MVSRSSLISLDVLDVILNPSVAVVDVCVCVCFFLIDPKVLARFKTLLFSPCTYLSFLACCFPNGSFSSFFLPEKICWAGLTISATYLSLK